MSASSENRIALVIGNEQYSDEGILFNPAKDATDITFALQRLNFKIEAPHLNLGSQVQSRAVVDFGPKADAADIAVIYFAGHGVEYEGENFLLPVTAELTHVGRIAADGTNLNQLVQAVARAKKLGLVIVDACRDNPFLNKMEGLDGTRSIGRGLVSVDISGGRLKAKSSIAVMFSAAPGTTAEDGVPGKNSPFAKALLEHIETPNIDLPQMFASVREAVIRATKRPQSPELFSVLRGRHILKLQADEEPPSWTPAQQESDRELRAERAYTRIETSTDASDFDLFINHFRGTFWASLAEKSRAKLAGEAKVLIVEAARENAATSVAEKQRAAAADKVLRERGFVSVPVGLNDADEIKWLNPKDADNRTFRDRDDLPDMVVIGSGHYTRGASQGDYYAKESEKPAAVAAISKPLAVSKYPITFNQWSAASSQGACGGYEPKDNGWGKGNRPVINVSWNEAQAYVQWISDQTQRRYRLLSETEWEYVCRAGKTNRFALGDGTFLDPGHALFKQGRFWRLITGHPEVGTREVTAGSGNDFGLCECHGNVWEWVQDCWHPDYSVCPVDGTAWLSGRPAAMKVVRGGSWRSTAKYARSSSRGKCPQHERSITIGFRIAREIDD